MATLNTDFKVKHGLLVNGNTTLNGTTNALGTITSGSWNGSPVPLQYGGTGQDLSAATGYVQLNAGTLTLTTTIPASAITGTLTNPTSGNADTASQLATARTIEMTGDVSWSTSFNGSGNATGTATLATQAGLTPGVYTSVTVDAKGRVTAGSTPVQPTGYTGSQGDVGYVGSRGNTGVGFTGSQGIQGVVGYVGSQGDIGYVGSRGLAGVGFTGSQGATGVGFVGSQGVIGYTGSQGAAGAQGVIGYTGSQGSAGLQGVIGYTGSQGAAGGQGVIGYTGSQGTTGSQGVIGYTGSQGIQGVTGLTGSAGYIGSTGYVGSQGIQGTGGYVGSQGIQGDVGYTGSGYPVTADIQMNSLGVGTAPNGTAGEILATGNITAFYSDDRLKTRLGYIADALDKVMSLDAFYYEANETAQALGYQPTKQVGVSAQQVEKVLPEAVAPAPIDAQYLTVKYEKLIPLLIAAIKELNAKISK